MRPEDVFVVIAILSIAVGLPLADRRVPPNRWYGVRVRATFADEHIWYEANAQAGRDLTLLGVVTLVLALALRVMLPRGQYAAVCGVVFVVGSLISVARSLSLASRLWRERHGGSAP
ncbi:MAG TPA: SdpI family protein [Gemmatimonadales bacterium]|nr:SdpI family protein [Gemmatimonadales bacterium]